MTFSNAKRQKHYLTRKCFCYELIPAVDNGTKLIRDAKDQPILNAAIVADVDVILTGDKDFLSLDMEHPRCMTVTEFLEEDGVGL